MNLEDIPHSEHSKGYFRSECVDFVCEYVNEGFLTSALGVNSFDSWKHYFVPLFFTKWRSFERVASIATFAVYSNNLARKLSFNVKLV